jgi:polysaccharide deacetylase family protein (PEP-CTERM system associated)
VAAWARRDFPRGGAVNARAPNAVINALTVDVEDYFQVSAFEPHMSRDAWDAQPRRVEANVDRILGMLAEHGARATFFTLGWLAERHPAMVRHSHGRATDQRPVEFRADIRRAKAVLEEIGGCEVRGYRAPSFSIGPANRWAFDCIAEAGYRYSSSVYPIRHDHYGAPDAPRVPHEVAAGLVELPVATVRLWNANLPAGGGGYFRLLPYVLSRWSLARINEVEGRPAIFYFHPWELDPEQPRVRGLSAKARFRHYLNLDRTQPRLARLMRDFVWGRVDDVFACR